MANTLLYYAMSYCSLSAGIIIAAPIVATTYITLGTGMAIVATFYDIYCIASSNWQNCVNPLLIGAKGPYWLFMAATLSHF